ncbi:hypothetical protein PanWU01x14_020100 [Parasponia andersonii]|uniref:Uncharacterized protein n=1 Tax=Parasponia andersonii TaxID=3476 RepID=A0A2P5DYL6_PARAD|nr:hypothetical protein PanWU01x14_020100 [Parasponia andersonii]
MVRAPPRLSPPFPTLSSSLSLSIIL